MTDFWTLLLSRRRRAAAAPVVTFVDVDGARVELSATSLVNAASKIANAFVDEDDEHGWYDVATVRLDLPIHWQRSTWLAGLWTAGRLAQLNGADPAVGLTVTTTSGLSVVDAGRPAAVVSLHPLGLPITTELPGDVVDATEVVRTQPDDFLGDPPSPDDAALRWDRDCLDQAQVFAAARECASAWGVGTAGRVLIGPTADPFDAWLAVLAVPLATDSSVILVAGDHDLERVAAQERATCLVR